METILLGMYMLFSITLCDTIFFFLFYSDFILTKSLPKPKLEEIILELQQPNFLISADMFKDYSSDIVAEVQTTFYGWPRNCSGYGITLLKFYGEVRVYALFKI